MAVTQLHREIEIITPLGQDVLLLQQLRVNEEIGRMFTINTEVLSEENISFEALLGENVTIRVNLPAGVRFFNGYVSNLTQAVDEGHYARYRITIKPWLWFLTRTNDCKIFQFLTVPDIIKEVCASVGFTDIEDKLTSGYRTWEYCVQYRESDFNFISRLMEQEGIYYYFIHEAGKHMMVLADGLGSHEPIPGYEELEYYPPDGTVVRDDKRVNNWSVTKNIQSGAMVLDDYDFERPKADLIVDTLEIKGHSQAEHEVFDYPGEYIETGDGSHYARTRIEQLHSQYEQAQGSGIAKGLNSGGLFTLAKYPREDQNKEYLVVSATHVVKMDDFEASDGGGVSYSNEFTVIDSGIPFRASSLTPKPLVQGPQTAVVVGPPGEEIYTNEFGQVKLQFHWDRYGEFNENSSCWVRVSQLWAGKTWGGIHLPRIEQEVIVEFLEGDPDRPIVTGRVYNGDQTVPYALPANKTQSGIKSRSSMKGTGANFNEIRFEDKKDEEQVYIHAELDQDNVVEHDETTFVGNDRTEDVIRDEKITIGRDRTELVKHDEKITIINNRTEKVGVNEDITIGNNRTEKVGVNETIVIGSNRAVTIGSNKTETIALTKTETIGVAKALSIGAGYQVSVGAAMNETVLGLKSQQVGLKKDTTVGGDVGEDYKSNHTQTVSDDQTVKVGKNQDVTVGASSTENVEAKKFISAGQQFELVVGASSLILNSDGSIILKGIDIKIEGSTHVQIDGKMCDIN